MDYLTLSAATDPGSLKAYVMKKFYKKKLKKHKLKKNI